MEDRRDLARYVLTELYAQVRHDQNADISLRNWCVTVWLATLLLGISEQGGIDPLLSLLPVGVFWLLSGFQNAFLLRHLEAAREIEYRLAVDEFSVALEPTLFLATPTHRASMRDKIHRYLAATFLTESVAGFFLLLGFISAVLWWRSA